MDKRSNATIKNLDNDDLDWIDFDQSSPEREIDLRMSINLYKGEISLKLNSLELTQKKISLKLAENRS